VCCVCLLPRDAVSVRPSARPFVCLSRSCILSKRINVSSTFFHRRVATPFLFSCTERYSYIPTPSPLTGTSNAGGVGKNRYFRPISNYRIDDCWSASNNCDGPPCSLPHRPSRISISCLSQPAARTTTMKSREQNRI